LEFVRQHPNWSAFIVFGLSLGESLPLVSLVLPFWAMLVGIGTIIAVADPLIFWTIVAAAAIGAEVSLQLPELVQIVGSVLAEVRPLSPTLARLNCPADGAGRPWHVSSLLSQIPGEYFGTADRPIITDRSEPDAVGRA
jgi:hypothetical protein